MFEYQAAFSKDVWLPVLQVLQQNGASQAVWWCVCMSFVIRGAFHHLFYCMTPAYSCILMLLLMAFLRSPSCFLNLVTLEVNAFKRKWAMSPGKPGSEVPVSRYLHPRQPGNAAITFGRLPSRTTLRRWHMWHVPVPWPVPWLHWDCAAKLLLSRPLKCEQNVWDLGHGKCKKCRKWEDDRRCPSYRATM